jgi:putative endonuclease
MGYLYILQSTKNGSYYIGSTLDVGRRLKEHNSGKTSSLKHIRPLIIVFQKTFPTIKEARQVEYKLKKAKSKIILEQIIHDQEIIMGQ